MPRRAKTRLPRLALLAYSRSELQRFVLATERIAAAAIDLQRAAVELGALTPQLVTLSDHLQQALDNIARGKRPRAREASVGEKG